MNQGFYHVLFLVLKHFWFLCNTFEICLCEICMEKDGKQHPLDGSLAQFKACFTSRNSQVGLSRCCHAGAEQTEWMGMDTNRAQHMPENSLLMQKGCQSKGFGCSDLSFRLFCADVPFICGISLSARAEGGLGVTYQLAGAALGAQHSLRAGAQPLSPREAVRQWTLSTAPAGAYLVAGSAWAGQVCLL